jgi:DNA-binding NarL/FixJ family response regulator
MVRRKTNRHGGPDDEQDLNGLLAIGDRYEQNARPSDTDASLQDLHLRASPTVTTGLEPEAESADSRNKRAADPARVVTAIEAEPRKPTVLVVDDDEVISQLISVNLQLDGFDVVGVAAHGRQAIELVRQKRPSLVTMNIMMPVMDGYEATQVIVRDYPRTQVVVVTARATVDDLYRCLEAGAVGFLTKPFSPDELTATLREVVDGGLPIAAAVIAAMPRKKSSDVPKPPTTFFTSIESTILRLLAANTPIDGIAEVTGLTAHEVAEIQSLIARKIQLLNEIEGYSKPQSS